MELQRDTRVGKNLNVDQSRGKQKLVGNHLQQNIQRDTKICCQIIYQNCVVLEYYDVEDGETYLLQYGFFQVTWLVAFYAAWSPACINFADIYAKLSHNYTTNTLKFGKVDVGRYSLSISVCIPILLYLSISPYLFSLNRSRPHRCYINLAKPGLLTWLQSIISTPPASPGNSQLSSSSR